MFVRRWLWCWCAGVLRSQPLPVSPPAAVRVRRVAGACCPALPPNRHGFLCWLRVPRSDACRDALKSCEPHCASKASCTRLTIKNISTGKVRAPWFSFQQRQRGDMAAAARVPPRCAAVPCSQLSLIRPKVAWCCIPLRGFRCGPCGPCATAAAWVNHVVPLW